MIENHLLLMNYLLVLIIKNKMKINNCWKCEIRKQQSQKNPEIVIKFCAVIILKIVWKKNNKNIVIFNFKISFKGE